MKKQSLIEIAQQALETEIQELSLLKERIDIRFENAVQHIYQCKGKLVVCGIGKSAHVANKLVATFNSTGTAAQFLHAAEAIHGDLGLLQKEDVVLCISNSGNSPEIVALAPLLKQNSAGLIAMTGNINSQLADLSDIVLDCGVCKEACPNQLAPTSSTTVQMALGDAIAVALMHLKKFTEKDFAKSHPGGALGKNLSWKVEQFLGEKQASVTSNSNINDVIISISASKMGITVVEDNHQLVGVITDGDLRRMMLQHNNYQTLKAIDIMSKHPKTIENSELAKTAFQLISKHNIGQLIVVDHQKYVGIISIHQLIEAGIE